MQKTKEMEGNRLIAAFDGGEWHPKTNNPLKKWSDCWTFDGVSVGFGDEHLLYHSSWDWLMPVVEKICNTALKSKVHYNTDNYPRVEIVPSGYVQINNLRDTPILTNVSIEKSLIKAVWKAVVQFIQWYNTYLPTKEETKND